MIEYLRLIKIDHNENRVENEELHDENDVQTYVLSIIEQISGQVGEREYEFKEGERTMRTYLDDLICNNNRDTLCLEIAGRLLDKENAAEARYHFTDIQKGILLIAYCKMTDVEYKVVICKADYTEFIEEATGKKRNGLPTKKKIFKSFAANVTCCAGTYVIGKMSTYDVNTSQTKYWYDEFLDLKPKLDDAQNTKKAFETIEAKVLSPIKRLYLHDYFVLRNMTIGYMRSEGEFSMDDYVDNVLATYRNPEIPNFDISSFVAIARELPERFKFDRRFNKVPKEIKSKIKKEIPLTNGLDLVIHDYIIDLNQTVIGEVDSEGRKYIKIRSDNGFAYAKTLTRNEN